MPSTKGRCPTANCICNAAWRTKRFPGRLWCWDYGFPTFSTGASTNTSPNARWGPSRSPKDKKGSSSPRFSSLLIPFIVVIPGILAFNLFGSDLRSAAVVKNAKVMAAFAPELYESLSDDLKPDAGDPLFANDLKEIGRRIDEAREEPAEQASLFRFTETLAQEHPADAQLILQHNLQHAGIEAPAATGSASNRTTPCWIWRQRAANARCASWCSATFDAAFPVLLKNLLPVGNGVLGFVLAAIFGAVVSSLASMLNSASTIASMDLYRKLRTNATSRELVTVGRICVLLFVVVAMVIAPALDDPAFGGIFTFIQEFQGFISPGVLAIFIFGLLVHRRPESADWPDSFSAPFSTACSNLAP